MSECILEIKNVSKTYNNIPALKEINFKLNKSEILCILGKNGSGKSTLVRIISGATAPDTGELFIQSQRVTNHNPKESKKMGVSTIYQDMCLIESLSVAENIYFENYPSKPNKALKYFGVVSWGQIYKNAYNLCEKYGYKINVKKKVKELGMGEKQIVAILKALSQNAKILILDEPSAALPDNDVEKLFKIIKQVKKDGISTIYITHSIDDIYGVGDRVVVLNDGEITKDELIEKTEVNDLIQSMVGRDMKNRYPKLNTYKGAELLRVEDLCRGDFVKNVSFSLFRGEIVGLTGLLGSGRSSIAKAIFGADVIDSGNIYINGNKVSIKSPIEATRNGISMIAEDRRESGLIPMESIARNITISHLKGIEYERIRWTINKDYERLRAENYAESLAIKRNSIKQKVDFLSGGNQQKTLIARCLFAEANIFLLDEPTKGIDIAAKVEIYNIMNELTREGKGILFISSDMSEILGMSDRILVVNMGGIVKQLMRNEASKERILYYASGGL